MASSHTTTLLSKQIGSYGYGLMGLTWRANPQPAEKSIQTIRTALSVGANFWNGGEFYGHSSYNSLVLLNQYFKQYPEDQDKVVLSVKGGALKDKMHMDGGRENVRRSVLDSLAQLQKDGVTKGIDIFECARVDPQTPIEETIGYLAELVNEGKIGGIGLSEVSASSIRRAAKVHPIAAVEVELSLWSTDIFQNGIAAVCAELNIPIVAYSPLGRGALTGDIIRRNADIPDGDMRKGYPKFQDDALAINNQIVEEVEEIAKRKGCTKAQIALAWVRAHSGRVITDGESGKKVKLGEIIPIPGATTEERVKENIRPDIVLSEEELAEFDRLIEKYPISGNRYPKGLNDLSNG